MLLGSKIYVTEDETVIENYPPQTQVECQAISHLVERDFPRPLRRRLNWLQNKTRLVNKKSPIVDMRTMVDVLEKKIKPLAIVF